MQYPRFNCYHIRNTLFSSLSSCHTSKFSTSRNKFWNDATLVLSDIVVLICISSTWSNKAQYVNFWGADLHLMLIILVNSHTLKNKDIWIKAKEDESHVLKVITRWENPFFTRVQLKSGWNQLVGKESGKRRTSVSIYDRHFFFYSKTMIHWNNLPKGYVKIPITRGFQDASRHNAR